MSGSNLVNGFGKKGITKIIHANIVYKVGTY